MDNELNIMKESSTTISRIGEMIGQVEEFIVIISKVKPINELVKLEKKQRALAENTEMQGIRLPGWLC